MKENSMNEEETEKLKDLKAVYSGAIQSGEIGIANMIKGGIDLIEKLQKENEELKNDYENLSNSVVVKNHCIKNSIPVQKIKDKIEEYKNMLKTCNKVKDIDRIKAINERILELEELLEGRK